MEEAQAQLKQFNARRKMRVRYLFTVYFCVGENYPKPSVDISIFMSVSIPIEDELILVVFNYQ